VPNGWIYGAAGQHRQQAGRADGDCSGKFCFAGGGGTHAELIAGILDRMTAEAETIDWWERATPRRHQ
jgi:hypothetical protein